MPKNVEIKARLKNVKKSLEIAESICNKEAEILHQEDIFFRIPTGKLKLRIFKDEIQSQLISYTRPELFGPKISNYSICYIDNPKSLANVLTSALGVLGTVKKTRYLFLYNQTRIHIDRVENLGDFLEFEVVLSPNQNSVEGEEIANFLISKFEISQEDLIEKAYIDLLTKL